MSAVERARAALPRLSGDAREVAEALLEHIEEIRAERDEVSCNMCEAHGEQGCSVHANTRDRFDDDGDLFTGEVSP